jgi:O-antigen ligase
MNTLRPSILEYQFIGMLLIGISFFSVLLISMIFHISTMPFFLLICTALALILYAKKPLFFLAFLVIIRMSLDFSAEYASFTVNTATISLSQLFGISIAGIGIISLIRFRRDLGSYPLNIPFLIIFLWGLASLTFSLSLILGVQELLRFFSIWSIGFLAYAVVQSEENTRTLFSALFFSALFPICFGIYQFVNGIGLEDDNVSIPRIFGTFSHPNVFSLYLATLAGITILFLLSFTKNLKEKIWSSAFLLILSLTLLLTYTRIGWIALFLFLILVALYRFRLALIPLILIPILLYAVVTPIRERIDESFQPTVDSSLTWRQSIWHDTITLTLADGNHSLYGYGMNTFPLVSESIRGIRLGSNDSHNDFVKFFVEGGIIGLTVFLLSLLLIGRALFLAIHTGQGAMRSAFVLTGILFLVLEVAALSDNVFKNTPVQWLFFITASILFALQRKK